jgi:hypothetical protein
MFSSMVFAILKIGMKLGRLISLTYKVIGTVLVVVQVAQSLGLGAAEAKEAKRVRKTRKPKQVAREGAPD